MVLVAGPPSHVPDRFSEPPGGPVSMVGILHDVSTWCTPHYLRGHDTILMICVLISIRSSNVETENKGQELETASATLAEGMHFIGNIESFRWDLDAKEDAGG